MAVVVSLVTPETVYLFTDGKVCGSYFEPHFSPNKTEEVKNNAMDTQDIVRTINAYISHNPQRLILKINDVAFPIVEADEELEIEGDDDDFKVCLVCHLPNETKAILVLPPESQIVQDVLEAIGMIARDFGQSTA